MLGFIAKKLLSSGGSSNVYRPAIVHHHQSSKFKAFHASTALKSSSSLQSNSKDDDFTVSYLISGIVTDLPSVLHSNPVKTLKPKFDILTSLGVSHEAVVKIFLTCPTSNLKKTLVPALDIIKKIVASNEDRITVRTRSWILKVDPVRTLGPNVALLRDIGMPERYISSFIMLNGYPFILEPEKFKAMKWERKVEVFRKWGWTESEFNVAFRKQPRIMLVSVAKIDRIMDYLVNKMGLDASFISRNPYTLLLNLKKRIIPRCSVVRVLVSKGLIEKNYSLNSVVLSMEDRFLKAYVEKHDAVSMELLALYHSLKH
ncbi:hypothetical protein QQ045_017019 [Rhodiola kirilowii]